ncbi:MAG: hypothetical protein ACO1SV_25600 [Fimbriimonas sp.]
MRNELNVLRLTVHRYRGLYIALAAYAGVLVVAGQLHLAAITPPIVSTLMLVYMMLVILTLGAFANPDSDLAGDAPALPTYLLRLPVSTRALALPPLLGAALWPAAAWLILVAGFMRPYGMQAPLTWPAALLGAIGPTLMAVQWAPIHSGRARLMLGLAAPLAIVVPGLWLGTYPANAGPMTIGYCLVAIAAGGAAWAGLAHSRPTNAGRVERSAPPARVRVAKAARPMPPFKSAMAAQRWLEWRRQGRNLPLLTTLALTALSAPLLWERDLQPKYFPEALSMNIYVFSAISFIPWIPLLFATVIGIGARRSEARGADGVYHPFFATRPLDGGDLVRAKAQVGVLSALTTIGICLAFALGWSLVPAEQMGRTAPYLFLVLPNLDPQVAGLIGAAMVFLSYLIWRNQAVGAFVDFLPSRLGKRLYGVGVLFAGFLAFALASAYNRNLVDPANMSAVTTGLSVLVALKLGTAAVVAYGTIRVRPSAQGDVVRTLAIWGAGAVIVSLAMLMLSAQGDANVAPLFRHKPALILFAIYMTPLARMLAPRWALEAGRHG